VAIRIPEEQVSVSHSLIADVRNKAMQYNNEETKSHTFVTRDHMIMRQKLSDSSRVLLQDEVLEVMIHP